jgi:flavin reductase (DIM6/NTAB) family NADH-FMN oxidoreductase RutF
MFYDPRNEHHGLPHNPIISLVVPRPIAWVSSVSSDGIANLAPYSFFNMVGGLPPFVMFSSHGNKDSEKNIEATKEFVVNMAVEALKEEVVQSSAHVAPDVDEFELTNLEKAECRNVSVPRVARSPIALECVLNQILPLVTNEGLKGDSELVIGEVVGVHIDESVIVNGMIDNSLLRPLTRLGYLDYAVVDEVFQMDRPDE